MQACELALLMWLTTLTSSRQSQVEWVTLQTEPQPLFEGDTLTLRCLIRDGSTVKWVYFYKDGTVLHDQSTTELRVERFSKKQDGIYKCSATWRTETIYSAEVRVSVTDEQVTLQTEPQPLFEGDTLTLRCLIRNYSTVNWVYFYNDGTVLHDQRTTELRVERVSKKQDGIYKCSATWWSETIYSAEVRVSVRDERVTLQTEPQPLFEGETLTLRCLLRDGSTVKWVYFYQDNRELKYQSTTELRVERVSKKQDGIYKCSARWWSETIYSAEVRVSVTELPQPALTREPSGEISEGDAVTLSCVVEEGSGGWRYLWYKDSQSSPPVYQTDRSSGTGAGYTISAVALSHSGEYWCRAERSRTSLNSQYSKALRIQVHELPQPALTREPSGEIFEGDSVTLSCGVEEGSRGWRYLWYKDSQSSPPVYQTDSSSGTGAGYTISAAALSHSGEYWCKSGKERTSLYSQYSHPIWVNVTALFSRVTLTASPGATVKEGEALNLTCEAVVNKTPRPELHYTIVRDGEPVTNSTDSALYSIASTEKSHTGNYTCAVESQGVKKSSQELHIEVQTSWHSTVAVGFSVGFFVIPVIVFTLLLLYHKMKGLPCIPGGKWRNHSDQDQDQPAGRVELSKRAQQPESEEIVYCDVDTSKHNPKKKVKPAETDIVYSAVKITAAQPAAANAEAMYATVLPKKKKK